MKSSLFSKVDDFLYPGYRDRGKRRWLMLLPVVILLLVLSGLYGRERFLHIPVTIKPAGGEVTGTDIYLFWNPLKGKDVRYQVQIDGVGPDFQNLLYEWDDYEEDKVKKGQALLGGRTYYWRIRSIIGGKHQYWSRAIAFRTREDDDRWTSFGLEIGEVEIGEDEIRVSGRADLPDNTIIYLQLIDPSRNRSLYRIAQRIRKGAFEQYLKPEPGELTPGAYEVKVCTYAGQEYPVSEILGSRGEMLKAAGIREGELCRGIINTAVLRPGKQSASASSPYLNLEVRTTSEGSILLSGKSNLPPRTNLAGIVYEFPGGKIASNNFIYLKEGEYKGEVKPSGFSFDFQKRSYRVSIVMIPSFQQGKVLEFYGARGEKVADRIVEGENLIYILEAVRSIKIGDVVK